MKREVVTDSAVRIGAELNDRDGDIAIEYLVADIWRVTLHMRLDKPSTDDAGFTGMTVSLDEKAAGGVERDISNRLLRLIPFRDAHQCADRLILDWSSEAAPVPPDAPRDPLDYAKLARSYAFFESLFPDQPLKQMAEKFNLNRNTLAARVNRAKDLGLLVRPSRTAPYGLTAKAKALLEEAGE